MCYIRLLLRVAGWIAAARVTPMETQDADRNLLAGVLALQADAITRAQFLSFHAEGASDGAVANGAASLTAGGGTSE